MPTQRTSRCDNNRCDASTCQSIVKLPENKQNQNLNKFLVCYWVTPRVWRVRHLHLNKTFGVLPEMAQNRRTFRLAGQISVCVCVCVRERERERRETETDRHTHTHTHTHTEERETEQLSLASVCIILAWSIGLLCQMPSFHAYTTMCYACYLSGLHDDDDDDENAVEFTWGQGHQQPLLGPTCQTDFPTL